ncbi:MAG: glycolate oxidase subunit GlcF [Pseudomonadota bacterium]
MQTKLADSIKDTPEGQEADAILRKCVHCGFCLAACPTYQLLNNELDSPRGRIYLMKEMLEGAPVTEKTQLHLDRCLTCRACETVCPSGVQYSRLVDIGRNLVESKVPRRAASTLRRTALRKIIPNQSIFNPLIKMGRALRPILPKSLKDSIPILRPSGDWPAQLHARKMLILEGCVQPGIAPSINAATARVLNAIGISLIRADRAGCCGAVSHHLNAQEEALDYVRRNIDAWWPHIEAGAEAIVVTASGCGTMVQEYGHLLRNDKHYAQRAERVSQLFRDVSQVIAAEKTALEKLLGRAETIASTPVAFHSPCSLQHGLKIRGVVESLLTLAGYRLTPVPDGHLCCGSAGTYSILQPEISKQLLANKVAALESGEPAFIATANIGCLTHIESGTIKPVRHWIELIDQRIPNFATRMTKLRATDQPFDGAIF